MAEEGDEHFVLEYIVAAAFPYPIVVVSFPIEFASLSVGPSFGSILLTLHKSVVCSSHSFQSKCNNEICMYVYLYI